MTLSLGVDTGGTYTDAVLLRDEAEVLAAAKALTTRHDLSVGIGEAVRAVLADAEVAPGEIGFAALSTTLATNALVEGQGGRIALILIGFRERDLEAHGLTDALKGDPVLLLSGGHDHSARAAAPLDEEALIAFLETHKQAVSAFAVAGLFAVRNPGHELRAMKLIAQIAGRPVSASHQLSAKLGGPRRAMTAVLNARLVGMIDRLITRAGAALSDLGVTAPMMVVRGDGALISVDQARERPIETILSGPAASIVGARWLTGAGDALVSDIGGTTTDVALLRNGQPVIDPEGARVGPYRTMVEAVAMRTHGLGGDSEVHVMAQGLAGGVFLGPRRLVPVALMAREAGDVVHGALDAALRSAVPGEHDGRFIRAVPGVSADGLAPREAALLERVGALMLPLRDVLRNRLEQGALKRLVERGLVQIGGVTPSDAAHVLGWLSAWDRDAAEKALALMARRRTGSGDRLAGDPEALARLIVDQLTHQTGLALLETAFAEDETDFGLPAPELARHVLTQTGLHDHRSVLRLSVGLNVPVVGLGASAATYYPAVGALMGTEVILPEHGGVANAIGAVVGRVTMRRAGTITAPSEGKFRVHLDSGPEDFTARDAALGRLESVLLAEARAAALAAGASDLRETLHHDIRTAGVEAREIFIEATVTAEVSGRPRIAAG